MSSTVVVSRADCTQFNFVVWGIFGGILCLFGYVGNTLSVVALQRDTRSATTTLLQALAVSDLVLLISVAVTDATPYICDYTLVCLNPWTSWPQVRYVWLLTPVAHMCSIWLVVLVAANRYWAVCRPHTVATMWSSARTVIYVASVVLIVIIINSPRLFEYRMEIFELPVNTCDTPEAVANASDVTVGLTSSHAYDEIRTPAGDLEPVAMPTVSVSDGLSLYNESTIGHVFCNDSETVLQVREARSWLGDSYWYRFVYKSIFVSIVLVLWPIVTLVLLSVFIIRALKQTQSYRMSQRHKSSVSVSQRTTLQSVAVSDDQPPLHDERVGRLEQIRRQSRSTVRRLKQSLVRDESRPGASAGAGSASREITFVLVTVVLVAVVCQTPLAVFHCVRYVVHAGNKCGHVVFYLETAAKVLVNINSCANFVIYCLLSPKFRSRLLEAITCQPRTHSGSKRAGPMPSAAPDGAVLQTRQAQATAVAVEPAVNLK